MQFAISILFYFLVFIISKGYIRIINPETAFRRMLSPIWIFYVVAFIGIYFIFKKVKEFNKIYIFSRVIFYLFLLVTSFLLSNIKGNFLLIILVLIPVLFYGISRIKLNKFELVSLFVIFLIFFGQIYFESYKKTYRYVAAVPNKAGYAIAQWLNKGSIKNKVLVYSSHEMIKYYLKKPVDIRYFSFNKESVYKNREKLMPLLLYNCKKHQIEYILFDMYLTVETRLWEGYLKKILHEERDKGMYFKVKKHLTYKGKYVASVLKPLYTVDEKR